MRDPRAGDEGPKVEQWVGSVEGRGLGGRGREALGLTGTRLGPFQGPELPAVEGPSQTGPEVPLCSRGLRLSWGPGLHT